jgi:dTDP-4-amino-4,6-dideoxygalactose transaminase
MTKWRIPLFDTRFDAEELEAVQRPLKARWLTMGEEVLKLEEELREATGAAHAIAVTNGTAALQLASAALDLGPGDEVLCPTLTFVATANAPRSLGARVHLCDSVGGDDLTVDPASLETAITEKTRAMLVVHYAGFPCRMGQIMKLADSRGIPVIEDCAHALFTRYQGKTLGLHGRVGCFSFYSNKNATSGEGGALLTNDAELAAKLRLLRSHGMTVPTLDRHRGIATSYDVVLPGYNCRMDEIRAALMRVQLRKLPGFLARRRELFARYAELLRGTSIQVPFDGPRFAEGLHDTAVHIMPTILPRGVERAAVMAGLKEAGIQTSIHYPLIHRFAAYRDQMRDLARTSDLGDRELTLPLYPAMSDQDVNTVVAELLKSVEAYQC